MHSLATTPKGITVYYHGHPVQVGTPDGKGFYPLYSKVNGKAVYLATSEEVIKLTYRPEDTP